MEPDISPKKDSRFSAGIFVRNVVPTVRKTDYAASQHGILPI